jgi:hypothetical protein
LTIKQFKEMKKLIFITTMLAISLSSCLKDSRYLDFASAGNIVNMPLSGLSNFGLDAVTSDTAVIKFGVDYATANPNGALTVTLGVDTTIVAAFNATVPTGGIIYNVLPSSAYVFTATSVAIPAGAQFAYSTITINKYLLDPAKSYMLPVVIKSANGVAISSNFSTHYFHVIGNDFAGTYRWAFERWSGTTDTTNTAAFYGASFSLTSGNTAVLVPVSPTEFQVFTGYDGGTAIRYDVTFTETGAGASAVYTNFSVSLVAADEAAVNTASGITFPQAPVFVSPTGQILTATLPGPYTFAQAQKLFHFQYEAMTSAVRYIIDNYQK